MATAKEEGPFDLRLAMLDKVSMTLEESSMRSTSRNSVAGLLVVLVVLLSPGTALAGKPDGGSTQTGSGEPDNDTQLSVLTPDQAAFVSLKRAQAAAVEAFQDSGAQASKGDSDTASPMFACEFDPCEDQPPPPYWPPAGPPSSKVLDTRARQQVNGYYCGPATGQVVINWSRGLVITDKTKAGANDPNKNWAIQNDVAGWMGTTTLGTGGAALAAGLNRSDAVRKPVPDWYYNYDDTGSKTNLKDLIVLDVSGYQMPLVLATAPHISGAQGNYLPSWPQVNNPAHHWIVVRGYNGLAVSTMTVDYQDSSAGYGGDTGSFTTTLSIMWQVNDWNQGGHTIW